MLCQYVGIFFTRDHAMQIATAANCSREIIDALQLKQKYIKRIEIVVDVDSFVFCRVEFYPDLTQIDAVTKALETTVSEYALMELKSNDSDVA